MFATGRFASIPLHDRDGDHEVDLAGLGPEMEGLLDVRGQVNQRVDDLVQREPMAPLELVSGQGEPVWARVV